MKKDKSTKGKACVDEKLLQYIWKTQAFASKQYVSTKGEHVTVLSAGEENKDSGPDFFNAKIQIGDTTWVGCVELHIKASDWVCHGHHADKAYDNVILHVVYDSDEEIFNSKGQTISTIEWKGIIDEQVGGKYKKFMQHAEEIVCAHSMKQVEPLQLYSWMDMLLIERLERRVSDIETQLSQCASHKEEVFYHTIAKSFGFKINALPMLLVAKSLPLNILAKQKNNLLQLEALFYGQAGMLEDKYQDAYPQELQKEYAFLQKKFNLTPVCNHSMWKYAKMYPSGFPTIRLSQLAALIHQSSSLLSKVLKAENVADLEHMFSVSASRYWNTHYKFDISSSDSGEKHLGRQSVHSIVINTILPFVYAYAVWNEDVNLKNKVVHFYECMPFENNTVVRKYQHLNVRLFNALHSQAMLELYEYYCKKKGCKKCAIGIYLLKF